jgi:hypothetical protein
VWTDIRPRMGPEAVGFAMVAIEEWSEDVVWMRWPDAA